MIDKLPRAAHQYYGHLPRRIASQTGYHHANSTGTSLVKEIMPSNLVNHVLIDVRGLINSYLSDCLFKEVSLNLI